MYWINLQRAFHGSNCLSVVMFASRMYIFWQFLIKGFRNNNAKQSLSYKRFCLLLLFRSNRRYSIISKHQSRGIVLLKKLHLQVAFHILFIGKIRPLITPGAITRPMNLSNSSKLTDHLSFPVTRRGFSYCTFLNVSQHEFIEINSKKRDYTVTLNA